MWRSRPHIAVALSEHWPKVQHAMMQAERGRLPAKVHTLADNLVPIDNYSVPLGADPYFYAREIYRLKGCGADDRLLRHRDRRSEAPEFGSRASREDTFLSRETAR
jgi:hypothetical protein